MIKYDFDSLRELEDGWDSYDAPKPSERAIIKASTILSGLLDNSLAPDRLLAAADGGVAIIFKGVDIRRALIEVLNNGEISTLLYNMEGFSDTFMWENLNESEIKNAAMTIHRYLS